MDRLFLACGRSRVTGCTKSITVPVGAYMTEVTDLLESRGWGFLTHPDGITHVAMCKPCLNWKRTS